jgi:hypothetical protein
MNPRYHFSIRYPSGWHTAESENGDGVTIESPNRNLRLRAWGENDVGLYDSLDDLAQATMKTVTTRCRGAVQETARRNVTVSGQPGLVVVWSCASEPAPFARGGFARSGDVFYSLLAEDLRTGRSEARQDLETTFQNVLGSWRLLPE